MNTPFPADLVPVPGRMPTVVARFAADRASLQRVCTAPWSANRRDRLRAFYMEWLGLLQGVSTEDQTPSDEADLFLLVNLIRGELADLDAEAKRFEEMAPLVPFLPSLTGLEEARRRHEDVDPRAAAGTLAAVREALEQARAGASARPALANRAAGALDEIAAMLADWYRFYTGYDPLFTWWCEKPYQALADAMTGYSGFLRQELAGATDPDTIVGDPVGAEALAVELGRGFIAYTPDELIEIGKREMEWCLREARKAAAELGFGDDWRAAVEHVKTMHMEPGGQPAMVRDLAREAEELVERLDLVTVPPLARECWRMEMLSAEQQKTSPFFLGGEVIWVSYPTNEMEHAQKSMAMRGNNRPFSRATVQHELIPGHYLQQWSQERYRPYRRIFYTPFWTEGWTLHWEYLLWDLGFPATPEERIGMLFWRMHRCARVIFSLSFHLGRMSAAECVEMLVNDVGHERDNALAEVRRSFGEDYGPLYQCAYLIGALQVNAIHAELVGTGRMSQRDFHDAVMRQNCMPPAVLRAILLGEPMRPEVVGNWRFYPAVG